MHPFPHIRQSAVEHARVGKITKGYATGGVASGGSNLTKGVTGGTQSAQAVNQRDGQAVGGKPVRARLDRPTRARGGRTQSPNAGMKESSSYAPQRQSAKVPYSSEVSAVRARGGRTKGKKGGTHVNIILGGPPPMAGAAPPPPQMAAPRPPVVPPMAPGGPPVMPPGMGPRARGGRTYARGGGVTLSGSGAASTGNAAKSGPGWTSSIRAMTPIQHTSNKQDTANIGRGKVITYKNGGRAIGGQVNRGDGKYLAPRSPADDVIQPKKKGGAVEAPKPGPGTIITRPGRGATEATGAGQGMSPNTHFGGGGGKARLMKAHLKKDGYRL